MVMKGDSQTEGYGFEFGTIYWMDIIQLICCKKINVCLKKTKNKRERGRRWAIKNRVKRNPQLDKVEKSEALTRSLVIIPKKNKRKKEKS